jgi:hypothetical protein
MTQLVVDPLHSLLFSEMTGQPRGAFVGLCQVYLAPRCQTLMQICFASRSNSLVADLAAERMHKLVACGDCPVWKFLWFGGMQNAMSSDEFLTSVFKGFRFQLCCRGSGYDREPGIAGACKARHLQHQLFIRAEAVDLGFDRLAQSFWYL